MKRVIEKGNLAFNKMNHICDLCKRWNGEFTDKDIRICKYNKDNKGLHSGLVKDYMENFKCKYYKRGSRYYTCKLQSKDRKTYQDGTTQYVVYKRGRFSIVEI